MIKFFFLFAGLICEDIGTLTIGISFFSETVQQINECKKEGKVILYVVTMGGRFHVSENFGFDWKRLDFGEGVFVQNVRKGSGSKVVLLSKTNKYILTRDCFQNFMVQELEEDLEVKNAFIQNEFFIIKAKKQDTHQAYLINFDSNESDLLLDNLIDIIWQQNGIYAIVHNPNEKSDLWDENLQLVFSENFFQSRTLLGEGFNKLIETNGQFFASRILDAEKKLISLYNISDQAKIREIDIGHKSISCYSFTLLKGNQNDIYLHITHRKDAKWGHLYKSEDGYEFELIYKNVIRDKLGFTDFQEIVNSPGTFLINALDQGQIAISDLKNQPILHENQKTYITNDDGKQWNQLKDNLHLQNKSSDFFSSVFSCPDAPGLILANGTKGEYLSNRNQTYLSNDHGLNWSKVSDSPSVFQCTKDGNFIVYIDEINPVRQMNLSIDHGHSFKPIYLTEDDFNVLEIYRVQDHNHFLLINGIQKVRDLQYGVVIPVDFSKLLKQECNEDDFVTLTSHCLANQTFLFQKKKKSTYCLKNSYQTKMQFVEKCQEEKVEKQKIDFLLIISCVVFMIIVYLRYSWKKQVSRKYDQIINKRINQFNWSQANFENE